MDKNRLEAAKSLKAEILRDHKVRDGIIHDFGRFEGEPVFVAAYYEMSLDQGYAAAECKDLNGYWNSFFPIKEEYREVFEIPAEYKSICVWMDDRGFVRWAATSQYEPKQWSELVMSEAIEHMGAENYFAD